jgi:hypothetical protein
MAASRLEVVAALDSTILKGRELVEVPILDSGEVAYALPISGDEIEAAWRAARSKVDVTGRWPVATALWGYGGGSFKAQVLEADLFSRFFFMEAPDAGDVSPRALCALSKSIDLSAFVAAMSARRNEYDYLTEAIPYELDDTTSRCGSAPSPADLERLKVSTDHDLERALLDFELANGASINPEHSRQNWFEPDSPALLLLPTRDGSEALAYLNWFGTSDFGSENYIALLRSWQDRFGAELVSHYGTMLQFLVSRPPSDLKESWPLACEHDLAGGSTLAPPGIKVRDYARALIAWDRWFLHDRP